MLKRHDLLLLIALIGAGAILKLLWVGNNALAHDEPFTVYWALQPWQAFRSMLATENNPPLYFLIMRGWVQIVPLDAGWLRVPSALFSTLAVWPLYLIGKRLGGTYCALAASLLYSISGYHLGFAHEVRSYSLFTLLSILSVRQLLRLADQRPHAWAWLLVVDILLVYTHFFGWLVVGLQLLFILLVPELKHSLRDWLRMAVFLLASYIPYAYVFITRAGTSISEGTWLTRPHLEEVYNMLWRWSNAPVIAVLLLALVLYTAVRHACRGTALGISLLWTLVPLFGLFLVSYWVPVYLDRYLVFAAPGWALLVGTSLAMLPKRFTTPATLLLSFGLLASFRPWERSAHTPESVVRQVEQWRQTAPCASVSVVPAWYRLTYRFAEDRERFANEDPALLHSHELEPGQEACKTLILVDADPPDAGSIALLDQLRSTYSITDSVLTSHKVWVKLFVLR